MEPEASEAINIDEPSAQVEFVPLERRSIFQPIETEGADPADLPGSVLRQADYLLHHPTSVMVSIEQGKKLWALSRTLFLVTVVMSAIYGAVMGGTNWFQASTMPLSTEFLMMLVTSIKVPCLFLLTLLIVLPPIYVSSTFIGSRATFGQVVALLLASMTITAIVLASMASVAYFFALTTRSYTFIKVLHVVIFAYAGMVGLVYLGRGFNTLVRREDGKGRSWLFAAWLGLYMFVGTQLAWVMRPFIGEPEMAFELFRERSGNFYENMFYSVIQLIE